MKAGGRVGLGYTYADAAAVHLVTGVLRQAVEGLDAFAIPGGAVAMRRAIRNLGREGLASCAIAAVDVALWDLKARARD